ncbi:histidinol-phosphatase [Bradyrhizobium sp. CCBAU 45389]|uniref:histidinol-phosphatase n=1 Tax=Bradyrhizobium sp. CCBAU 45389 TaxID=858429 RepID=UPI0023055C9F|nr:histidinol-phosphatase [Bradyrhizobium sp. CCBAU 45389]MDA9397551.1 histidinol phosphate phosphatase [Bradyrhizobium sp. CCBAU 45389]
MAHPAVAADDADVYLSFAAELADLVRPTVLSYFRTPLDVVSKSDDSPVTIADRTVELRLRERIEERFPEHGIIGEEIGGKPGGAFTWIVDPIDGTKSFITGFPLFGTLIALTCEEQPFCGLIDIPFTGERWMARPGLSLFGGRLARTSACKNIADARFYTTSPDMFAGGDAETFERISRAARLRRFGGDCYIYGLLASGHCDIVLETGLQPHDYMALIPIVQGAGGCITDWTGRPLTIRSEGHVLAAATPRLHAEALALIGR